MNEEIVIEQMEISEKGKVLAFLKNAYADNPRHSDPAYWDWHFVDSPHIEADKLPIWLAKSGERIAGQLATLPVELNIQERKVRALWLLDLIVGLDFRRQGIGKKLAMAAEKFSPYLLGVNTDQQHAPALLKGLNWVVVSKIPRFHKILFPGESLQEISRLAPLRKVTNIAFAPFRSIRKGKKNADSELRVLDGFDSSFDELWDRSKQQWNCSTARNSVVLNWQFSQQPGKRFDVIGYYSKNRLCGYAVLFFRKRSKTGSIEKGAISDIFYEAENGQEIVDSLIEGALEIAVERRAGGLVVDAMDPLLEQRFRSFGFWKVNSQLQLMAKAPDNREMIYDRKNWFLTRGDSDISIFEDYNLDP